MSKELSKEVIKTVLVVEDNPELRAALVDILQEAGYRVQAAADGGEALSQFLKLHPDLILSCISMPVMDGYALLKKIRKTTDGQLTPFIFLTSLDERVEVRYGMAQGVDAYLTKPIQRKELTSIIEVRLERFEEQLQSGLLDWE